MQSSSRTFLPAMDTTGKAPHPPQWSGIHPVPYTQTFCRIINRNRIMCNFFEHIKEAKIMRLTLQDLRHPQPPTPIHCDNTIATGISNDT